MKLKRKKELKVGRYTKTGVETGCSHLFQRKSGIFFGVHLFCMCRQINRLTKHYITIVLLYNMKQAYIQRRNVGHQNKYYTIFMKRKHSIIMGNM
jgi:hypothetical protein